MGGAGSRAVPLLKPSASTRKPNPHLGADPGLQAHPALRSLKGTGSFLALTRAQALLVFFSPEDQDCYHCFFQRENTFL